ncbi:hypothetical protein D3C85_1383110 [compost metagenome]
MKHPLQLSDTDANVMGCCRHGRRVIDPLFHEVSDLVDARILHAIKRIIEVRLRQGRRANVLQNHMPRSLTCLVMATVTGDQVKPQVNR